MDSEIYDSSEVSDSSDVSKLTDTIKTTYEELIDYIDVNEVGKIKTFICKHCESIFKKKQHIVAHFNRKKKCYDKGIVHTCTKCGKEFAVKRDLHKHVNRQKSCVKNTVIDMKKNNAVKIHNEEDSIENKYNNVCNENKKLIYKIESLNDNINNLENKITSLKSSHDEYNNHVNLFFTEFYVFPSKSSNLFPQPYFAMIIIINKIKNNTLEHEYLYYIISHLSTFTEIEHFVFPLILTHFYDIKNTVKLINMLISIYDDLLNNRVYKINDKKSITLRLQIKHIIGMIYYWINKYKINHTDIETINKHFSIPQHFYTFYTDINLDFDFNSLIL
jgi:hypothetical protein